MSRRKGGWGGMGCCAGGKVEFKKIQVPRPTLGTSFEVPRGYFGHWPWRIWGLQWAPQIPLVIISESVTQAPVLEGRLTELSVPHWTMCTNLCFHQNCRQSSCPLKKIGDLGSFHGSRQRMKSKGGEDDLILKVHYWALGCQSQKWNVIGNDNQTSK